VTAAITVGGGCFAGLVACMACAEAGTEVRPSEANAAAPRLLSEVTVKVHSRC
jgi:hypothetical protein